MEDQRNWSDASFKTYGRPLERPWPFVLPAGEPVTQSVAFSVRPVAGAAPTAPPTERPVALEVDGPTGARFPEIGLVVTAAEVPAALAALDRLEEIGPQRILCAYDPTAGDGPDAFAAFARLQAAFPAAYDLEYVVVGEGDLGGELAAVAAGVADGGLKLASVAVCPAADRRSTPPGSDWPACPPLEEVYAAARVAFPGLALGGGMFSYFTELNRKRPPVALLDFVTHATNPIVHAADDDSVMETLEALPHITRSTRAIIGAARYRIGPSTLGMRQNPYGARTLPETQTAGASRWPTTTPASAAASPPPGPPATPPRSRRRVWRPGCRRPSPGRAGSCATTGACCRSARWCATWRGALGPRC